MAKIKISEITKVAGHKDGTSKTTSKDYTVFDFVVTGTIDGVEAHEIYLAVLNSGEKFTEAAKKKVDAFVVKGQEFDGMAKTYNGVTTYSVFLPKADDKAKGGYSGGKGGYAPATKYSRDELKAIYAWCVKTSGEVLGIGPDESGMIDHMQLQALQAGAATLLIACQKAGTK